jgi:hypothetical protein
VFKKLYPAVILSATLLAHPFGPSIAGSPQAPSNPGNRPIICSVMESFEEQKLGTRAIVFHQRDKVDGPRLGDLLLKHSGEEMELEARDGRRYRATIYRVKSCFGRGLAIIPTNRLKLSETDEFTLRLP